MKPEAELLDYITKEFYNGDTSRDLGTEIALARGLNCRIPVPRQVERERKAGPLACVNICARTIALGGKWKGKRTLYVSSCSSAGALIGDSVTEINN